eukprot:TRINITY_DN30706_c0_g1_i1.p1 TRINITY_DN30706_c0_g1~~TRINITY_DN30706_c0_g1_i1.p1  ORF type:complete len:400 (+),score=59.47 TRINITY_DN30706_c0_g1_i1:58-1200(+)
MARAATAVAAAGATAALACLWVRRKAAAAAASAGRRHRVGDSINATPSAPQPPAPAAQPTIRSSRGSAPRPLDPPRGLPPGADLRRSACGAEPAEWGPRPPQAERPPAAWKPQCRSAAEAAGGENASGEWTAKGIWEPQDCRFDPWPAARVQDCVLRAPWFFFGDSVVKRLYDSLLRLACGEGRVPLQRGLRAPRLGKAESLAIHTSLELGSGLGRTAQLEYVKMPQFVDVSGSPWAAQRRHLAGFPRSAVPAGARVVLGTGALHDAAAGAASAAEAAGALTAPVAAAVARRNGTVVWVDALYLSPAKCRHTRCTAVQAPRLPAVRRAVRQAAERAGAIPLRSVALSRSRLAQEHTRDGIHYDHHPVMAMVARLLLAHVC